MKKNVLLLISAILVTLLSVFSLINKNNPIVVIIFSLLSTVFIWIGYAKYNSNFVLVASILFTVVGLMSTMSLLIMHIPAIALCFISFANMKKEEKNGKTEKTV